MKTKNESTIGIKDKASKSQVIRTLFENQLKDIYWAEKELTRFMPELVSQISSEELVDALEEHMELTKKQVTRLEKIFKLMGSQASAKKCEAMAGLVKEAEEVLKEAGTGAVRDAFVIGAVQKVEHYETASYGTLKAVANLLGEFEVATLLGETLKEEKEADEKLTAVAENFVNIEAARESDELEEEGEEEVEDEEFEAEEDFDEEEELEGNLGRKSRPGSPRRY